MTTPATPTDLQAQIDQHDAVAMALEAAAVAATAEVIRRKVASALSLTMVQWQRAFSDLTSRQSGMTFAHIVDGLSALLRGITVDPQAALLDYARKAKTLGIRQGAVEAGVGRVDLPVRLEFSTHAHVAEVVTTAREKMALAPAMLDTLQHGTFSTVQATAAPAMQSANTVERAASTVTNTELNNGITAVADHIGAQRVWISERDSCLACAALAGQVVDVGQSFDLDATFGDKPMMYTPIGAGGLTGPPRHPNCFPAGVVVSGPRVDATTTRWYSGEIVRVRVASGHVLTVTPNHPILTTEGWVAAGLLNEGSKVVRERDIQGMLATDPDDYQQPTPIEQVPASLLATGGVVSPGMPTTAEDFHGDGREGNVDVVRANRVLQQRVQIGQPSRNGLLVGARADLPNVSSNRAKNLLIDSLDTSASSSVGSLGEIGAFVSSHPLHSCVHGAAAVAKFNTSPFKEHGHNRPGHALAVGNGLDTFPRNVTAYDGFRIGRLPALTRSFSDPRTALRLLASLLGRERFLIRAHPDRLGSHLHASSEKFSADIVLIGPELVGEIPGALSGLVSTDEVVDIKREPFSGHVYNLETSGGWYSADGFIVHNCRCRTSPWLGQSEPGVIDFPTALRRESERSVLRGFSLPSESRAARTRAADRLLKAIGDGSSPSGWQVPKSVRTRARKAIDQGTFTPGPVPVPKPKK